MSRFLWFGSLLLVVAALVSCSKNNSNASRATNAASATATHNSSLPSGSANSSVLAAAASGSVTSVARAARGSIVRIDASGQVTSTGPFGLSGTSQASGTGTGVILDTQGHILTNNHVVTLETATPAQSLTVTLPNGKHVSAKLIGRDPQTDLSVIQVNTAGAGTLKPIQWANPSSIVVGEPVVAIGYALDLGGEPTVTTGVVSATNREINEQIMSTTGTTPVTISGAI